jgi:hypothetical protein
MIETNEFIEHFKLCRKERTAQLQTKSEESVEEGKTIKKKKGCGCSKKRRRNTKNS